MKNKIVYLLIGPKGSGKSFIGTLMDERLGIRFIRVENISKKVKKDRQIDDQSYIQEAFQAIEKGVREALKYTDKIVFESTGVTDSFDRMLENLKKDFAVITIGIRANEMLCLHRVKSRDQSIHVNVSDEQVNQINSQVLRKNIKTDFAITNENKSPEQLMGEIKMIIRQS